MNGASNGFGVKLGLQPKAQLVQAINQELHQWSDDDKENWKEDCNYGVDIAPVQGFVDRVVTFFIRATCSPLDCSECNIKCKEDHGVHCVVKANGDTAYYRLHKHQKSVQDMLGNFPDVDCVAIVDDSPIPYRQHHTDICSNGVYEPEHFMLG